MDEIKPKYSEWLSEYTFDNCAVGRKAYGEFLASFLAEEKDGFLKRNSDNFYRYLDNPRWVDPDFDRLTIGYGISKEKSLKIRRRLRAGDCPENTTLEHITNLLGF